jgi:hypothetical protein
VTHQIVRMSSGDVSSIECECGWSAAASNPIPLFEEWHDHRCDTVGEDEEANAG